jgi:DNA-directed RNA polymerase subunit RPC12/RpoP
MTKCLECGKPVEQTKGKREKKYCDDKCRAKFYVKKGKPEPKRVELRTYQKVVEERDMYKKLLLKCESSETIFNAENITETLKEEERTSKNATNQSKEANAATKTQNTPILPQKEKEGLNEAKNVVKKSYEQYEKLIETAKTADELSKLYNEVENSSLNGLERRVLKSEITQKAANAK